MHIVLYRNLSAEKNSQLLDRNKLKGDVNGQAGLKSRLGKLCFRLVFTLRRFDNGKEEGGFTFWSCNPCTVSQF